MIIVARGSPPPARPQYSHGRKCPVKSEVIANAYYNTNGETYAYHGGTYDKKHVPLDKLAADGNKDKQHKDSYCYQDLDHHISKCVWSLISFRVAVCQWLAGFPYFDVEPMDLRKGTTRNQTQS